jgi:hypothetical protein
MLKKKILSCMGDTGQEYRSYRNISGKTVWLFIIIPGVIDEMHSKKNV